MVNIEDFLIRYPEFKNAPSDRLKLLLGDAMDQISKKYWRQFYEQGVYALLAHKLFIGYGKDGNGTGNAKPNQEITSKSAGEISLSYGSVRSGFEGKFGSYPSTTYGQRYLELSALIQPTLLIG